MDAFTRFVLTLTLSLTIFSCSTSGLDIVFEKSPDVVQETLTGNLSMRCAASHNGTDDVRHVSSLVITRDGGHVAIVTSYDAAKAVTDLDNLKVIGSIPGSNGELGYLELEWTYPTAAQGGEYVCELNALNNLGHSIAFSKHVEVKTSTPNLRELIQHTHQVEVALIQHRDELAAMREANETLVAEIVALKANITELSRCCPSSLPIGKFPIRLVAKDGTIGGESGRVEVFKNGVWGTICDNNIGSSFSDRQIFGKVICRQIGLPWRSAIAGTSGEFGPGTGPILMDYVSCTGSETNIWDCPHIAGGPNYAGCQDRYNDNVGVFCG